MLCALFDLVYSHDLALLVLLHTQFFISAAAAQPEDATSLGVNCRGRKKGDQETLQLLQDVGDEQVS